MKYLLSALLLGILLTGHALAGSEKFNRCFHGMDTDGDEIVTMIELQDAYPQEAEKTMTTADANRDGALDHDEWEAFKESLGLEDLH